MNGRPPPRGSVSVRPRPARRLILPSGCPEPQTVEKPKETPFCRSADHTPAWIFRPATLAQARAQGTGGFRSFFDAFLQLCRVVSSMFQPMLRSWSSAALSPFPVATARPPSDASQPQGPPRSPAPPAGSAAHNRPVTPAPQANAPCLPDWCAAIGCADSEAFVHLRHCSGHSISSPHRAFSGNAGGSAIVADAFAAARGLAAGTVAGAWIFSLLPLGCGWVSLTA
jgi:hypothetical protein